MIIEYDGDHEHDTRSIQIGNIPVGTAFTGQIGTSSSLFLKTYDGVVDLAWPSHTWSSAALFIMKYRVREVKIIVKGSE